MKRNIKVRFADGQTAVVAFGRQGPARVELVIRAWALLYQREVRSWEQTSLPAEYCYEGRKKEINRYDEPRYHDYLSDVLPLAEVKQSLGK